MAPTHNDIERRELLPWYLNGTLSDGEAKNVHRELDRSDELRSEAAETGRMLKALAEDVDVPMLTHERLQSVMSRLDDSPQATCPPESLGARLRAWLQNLSLPKAPRPLPVALSGAMALVAVTIMMRPDPGPADYVTLYEDRPVVPIELTFVGGVGDADVQTLFDELAVTGTRQVDGSYRIELPADTSVGELYQVLQGLRGDGRVADAQAQTEED